MKSGGVDHVAVITARMKGWKTRTFTEKVCLHHRKMGSAQRGPLMSKFKDGQLDYALGGHPLWELFRVCYQMSREPRVLGGLMLFAGYLGSAVRREKRPVSKDLVAFRRREQMQRLKKFLIRSKAAANTNLQSPTEHA